VSRSFSVRDYASADFDALHKLDLACYPPGISYTRRTLKWFLALRGAECLVAKSSETTGDVLGFIIAEHEGAGGHVITLDVSPAARRSGVGTALLDEIEKRLAARGVSRVELETATSNEAGVAFWQHHGYRTHGVIPRYYLGRLDAYAMFKTIAPTGGPGTK
jgi:ribosomal protein S18 acetylase RimI-like enzyme